MERRYAWEQPLSSLPRRSRHPTTLPHLSGRILQPGHHRGDGWLHRLQRRHDQFSRRPERFYLARRRVIHLPRCQRRLLPHRRVCRCTLAGRQLVRWHFRARRRAEPFHRHFLRERAGRPAEVLRCSAGAAAGFCLYPDWFVLPAPCPLPFTLAASPYTPEISEEKDRKRR